MATPAAELSQRALRIATQLNVYTSDPSDVDVRVVAKLLELGVSGVSCHFGLTVSNGRPTWEDPRNADLDMLARAGAVLREGGIEVLSTWGYWAPLVSVDSHVRREAVAQVAAAADIAVALGCPYVVTGPGSNAPEHGWCPHPANQGEVALARLIEALDQAVPLVAERGVKLALKPHVLSTVDSPAVLRQTLQAVESPNLVANFDPANLVRVEDVYSTRMLMDANIAAATTRTAYAHAKDFVLQLWPDTISVIAEVPVGEGLLDLPYFLDLASRHSDGGWVIVEHLRAEQMSAAMSRIRRGAREAGLAVLPGDDAA